MNQLAQVALDFADEQERASEMHEETSVSVTMPVTALSLPRTNKYPCFVEPIAS